MSEQNPEKKFRESNVENQTCFSDFLFYQVLAP